MANMKSVAVAAVSISVCLGPAPGGSAQEAKTVAKGVKVEGQRVWIEGVARYTADEPLFEAVGIVARHLGATQSTEYLLGISGAAFRIAGICPCAPTSSAAMSQVGFAKLLGYEVEQVDMGNTCKSWSDLQPLAAACKEYGGRVPPPSLLGDSTLKEQTGRIQTIVDRVKAGIRSGAPVVVWHAFSIAEYDVVTGYDDETGEFLGWGSLRDPEAGGYVHAPQGRMVEAAYVGGLPNAILLSGSGTGLGARTAEIAALKEAVKHGRSQENVHPSSSEAWCMLQGIACYSRWVSDWARPDKKREMGDAYSFSVYRKTHAAAAGFLREIAPKYGAAREHLVRAAECFEAETQVLEKGRALLGWSAPEGPDAERNQQAAELLAKARDHYAAGIGAVELALERID